MGLIIVILLLIVIVLLGGGPLLLFLGAGLGVWLIVGLAGMVISFPLVYADWWWQQRRRGKAR